jgi:hypothetical protein
MKKLLTLLFVCTTVITQAQYKETRNISNHQSISVATSIQVEYIHSNKNEVIVECQNQEHVPLLLTEVKNGVLEIKYKPNTTIRAKSPNTVKVYSNAKLKSAKVSSSGKLTLRDAIKTSNFEFSASSSGKIYTNNIEADKIVVNVQSSAKVDLLVVTESLEVNASSSSDALIKGKTAKMHVNMSSSADVDLRSLTIKSLYVDGSSSAKLLFNTANYLENRLSSSAKVRYHAIPNQIPVNHLSSGAKFSQN